MTVSWKVISLVTLMTASQLAFSPSPPPRCIESLLAGESGARADMSAPEIAPSRGRVGTAVTIKGGGFPPGAHIVIAAVYAERECSIEGLGDQFLGSTRADGRGTYTLMMAWPATFDPVLGRNQTATKRLPQGRYYLFALPCSERAACSFASGTRPGGPFVLGSSPGAWATPVAGVVSGVFVLSVVVLVAGLVRQRQLKQAPR